MADLDNLTDKQIRARNDWTRDVYGARKFDLERAKACLAWLRLNPYSTSEEAIAAVRVSPGSIYGTPRKFIRWVKDEKGQTRWYVDGELEKRVLSEP